MDPKPSPTAANNVVPDLNRDLKACLPSELREPSTTITKVTEGLSGAGVYRVEALGAAYVLKRSSVNESAEVWDRRSKVHQLAADAGLAPAVVHMDSTRRAVLSRFVADRSFPAFYQDPRTHESALAQLGTVLRRVHDLPIPAGSVPVDARPLLVTALAELTLNFAVPPFVTAAISDVLAEAAAPSDLPFVLSHNDVNPSNLVYDGTTTMLLDWDTAAPNEPLYDLAAISLFMRMDDVTSAKLIAAHDGISVSTLPPRFHYLRRMVAAFCGATILKLAFRGGHPGANGSETLDSAPSLLGFYQRLRAGELSLASAEGQWCFGLALIKASAAR